MTKETNIMFKRLQGLIAGVIIGALLAGGAAYAAATVRQLEVAYNDIKIVVGGQRFYPTDVNGKSVEPFIADGTTYMPVRAVAQALGRTVDWDGSTQTVYISGDTSAAPNPAQPTPTPTPTPAASGVFEDSLTGPLSAHWTTSGSVQSLGERGLLLRGSGEFIKNLVVSNDILPEDCWDYTVEFEFNVPGDMKSSWVYVLLSERLNIAENEYVEKDYIALDVYNSYIWDSDVDETTSSDTGYKYDTYHKIKVDVTGKKADLFMDGVYLTSRALGGGKSTITFKTNGRSDSGYIIRNFKLTVKK
jgi:hypothetical protein